MSTVVLVEDYLSAVRVGQHYDTYCLWGTKCSYEFLKELFDSYETVLVWLDNDGTKETNSGQVAAQKICKMANSILSYKNRKRLTPLWAVKNVLTENDPKTFSDTEIREILEGVLNE